MPFSETELVALRTTHVAHYGDHCKIGTQGTTQSSTGHLTETFTYGTEIECGFKPAGGKEREAPNGTVLRIDAVLRLPIGTEVHETDRIEITKRNGEAVTGEIYQATGEPRRGVTGLQLDLVKVKL